MNPIQHFNKQFSFLQFLKLLETNIYDPVLHLLSINRCIRLLRILPIIFMDFIFFDRVPEAARQNIQLNFKT